LQFVTKLVYSVWISRIFDLRFKIGKYAMRNWVRSSAISRFAGVVTGLWLCGMGAAWAGTGGSDLGIQSVVDGVCLDVSMTCPKVPTITQAILQMSGVATAAPDYVRGPQGNLAVAGFTGVLCSVSGGILGPQGSLLPVCSQANAVNAVNPLVASPVAVSDLPSFTPLAFTTGKGQAVPVPFGTKGADSFFYAVAAGPNDEPNTLIVIFDYPTLTSSNFQNGQVVANVSLPLQVLNSNGSERLICGPQSPNSSTTSCQVSLAQLQINACNSGSACVKGFAYNVVGDFSSPGTSSTASLSQLNIQASASFGSSPNSSRSHFILEVQVPLLVTQGNDPAYFGLTPSDAVVNSGSFTFVNQLTGLPTAFTAELKPTFGIAPQTAPACPSGSCPPPATTYPFCASFAGNGGGPLTSAVATFLVVGTDATTYVSSPVPAALVGSQVTLKCPF
jgi:hypothetical protein